MQHLTSAVVVRYEFKSGFELCICMRARVCQGETVRYIIHPVTTRPRRLPPTDHFEADLSARIIAAVL